MIDLESENLQIDHQIEPVFIKVGKVYNFNTKVEFDNYPCLTLKGAFKVKQ